MSLNLFEMPARSKVPGRAAGTENGNHRQEALLSPQMPAHPESGRGSGFASPPGTGFGMGMCNWLPLRRHPARGTNSHCSKRREGAA